MNYLAHARNHLGRPYALAGTAVPDLLSISDRRCKLRERHLPEEGGGLDPVTDEIRSGVRAHFDDDRWFHQTPAFHEVTGELARRMRAAFPTQTRLRASVLAHIGMEMLLDGELARRDRSLVKHYYLALHAIDPGHVAGAVNRWAPKPALRLRAVLHFFRNARFLDGYGTDEGFAVRLDQVSRRAGMGELPDDFVSLVPALREVVVESADALLTRPPEAGDGPPVEPPAGA